MPVPANRSPVQGTFNPAAKPACRLCLACPDCLKAFHDQRGIDAGHRQGAEHRVGIGRQSVFPLFSMLGTLPASTVGFDIGIRALPKGDRLRRSKLGRVTRSSTSLDRINACKQLFPAIGSLDPRLGQADSMQGAQAHLARPAIQHETKQPGLRAGFSNLQVQSAAVRVTSGLLGRSTFSAESF